MRVLVTRPEPDARDLALRLAATGHEAVVDPLLEVEPLPIDPAAFADAAAVVATSRNALRSLAASPALAQARSLPLFAVGGRTEALARELGFARIVTGPGTARELAGTIRTARPPDGKPLVYLAGERLAFDLAPELRSAGYDVRQIVAYRTVAAKSLRASTRTLLEGGEIGAVLLLSPRTAAAYRDLVLAAGLQQAVHGVAHVCLSPAIAAALAPLSPESVTAAGHPTIEELLALLAARRHTPPRAG